MKKQSNSAAGPSAVSSAEDPSAAGPSAGADVSAGEVDSSCSSAEAVTLIPLQSENIIARTSK